MDELELYKVNGIKEKGRHPRLVHDAIKEVPQHFYVEVTKHDLKTLVSGQ